MRLIARGDARVVVRRHRELMGALVPMPDYWFLVELEEELSRCRVMSWPRITPREVAQAVIEKREQTAAATRKRRAELKQAELAERKALADLRRSERARQRRSSMPR
jgi:hypothetical protein